MLDYNDVEETKPSIILVTLEVSDNLESPKGTKLLCGHNKLEIY